MLPGSDSRLSQIPCTTRNRILLIALDEVEFVHTDQSGIHVISGERCGVTELTLKLLQERTALVRCHRQYLINLDQISEIELLENGSAEAVTRSAKRVPISRRHLREIRSQLLLT